MTDAPEPLVYLRSVRLIGPYSREEAEILVRFHPDKFEIVETTGPGGSGK